MSAVESFLLGGDPAQGTPIVPRAVICIFACGGNFVAFAFDGHGSLDVTHACEFET
jgi:hypothetical protein